MMAILKAEFQKSKRTSANKFIIATPLLTILLTSLWGGGQNGAYNWWYTMFLPGMLTIISSQIITKEKDISYKGLFLYPQDKGTLWLGKITYSGILLVISNFIFMTGIAVIGACGIATIPVYSFATIPLRANIFAAIILVLTSLFQIPICLFLTVKFNMFVTILFNMAMTIIGVVSFGTGSVLKFSPYVTISKLMCPILHILPNGLSVPLNSPLLNGDTIIKDTSVSIITFIILTVLTALWFRKREAN